MTTDRADNAPIRSPAVAMNGMVSSEHPLATQAGIDVLRRGGNAFDAAMAVSAVLPVVKPERSHLGGDAYILVWPRAEGRVTAICSGGMAPSAATPERYAEGIPAHGGAACAVPGLVDAWAELHGRWCTRPMAELLAPAIAYARDGFGVTPEMALVLRAAGGLFTKYDGLARMLYPEGRAPVYGEVLRQPDLARTIEAVADGGRAAFYDGEIAGHIAAGVRDAGGCMSADDLREHHADVLEPLSTEYRGHTVYETPPNSQGLILLEELNIVEGLDLAGMGHLSADAAHHMVEAKKLAFEDRHRFAGDPARVEFDPTAMISKEWAEKRRADIDPLRARADVAVASSSDTTSFVVADRDGNVCSFIQSIFAPFGSAVAIDGTGIIMNNRMRGFSLDPSSPNMLAPRKRTMHTLNTYLVFRDGAPYIVGNTPGADYQVQTNLQVITGLIDYGLDAQAAVDAPRWGHTAGELLVEPGIPEATRDELARRGHKLRDIGRAMSPTGRAQCIMVGTGGVMSGGCDSRGEGLAAGW